VREVDAVRFDHHGMTSTLRISIRCQSGFRSAVQAAGSISARPPRGCATGYGVGARVFRRAPFAVHISQSLAAGSACSAGIDHALPRSTEGDHRMQQRGMAGDEVGWRSDRRMSPPSPRHARAAPRTFREAGPFTSPRALAGIGRPSESSGVFANRHELRSPLSSAGAGKAGE